MTKHRTGHLVKRGKNFYCRWTVDGRVFLKVLRDENGAAITTRREAEEVKTKFMAAFAFGDRAEVLQSIASRLDNAKTELANLQDRQAPAVAIANAWTEYLNAPNRPDSGESTLRQYVFQFGAFARWMGETHPDIVTLRDVAPLIAEEYAANLSHSKFSPGTYNKHLNLVTLVFRVLKKKARLAENPWEDIQRKRITAQGRRELTIDELRSVCQSAKGELRVLLGIGVYSGLRLGDCATLRWAEVDLQRNFIRRIPNKTARRNPKPVIIPIHSILRDMLAQTAPQQRVEYVLPGIAALYLRRTDMVTSMVQRHFIACGIKPHKPGTGGKGNQRAVVEVGFHSLRHTFVSLCRESNAPLAVVESIVGHSNPAMTRHYTHVGELAAGRAVAGLPNVMGEAITAEPQKRDTEALLREVKAVAENLTGTNWIEKKAAILALVDTGAEAGQTEEG
jgi:integrase